MMLEEQTEKCSSHEGSYQAVICRMRLTLVAVLPEEAQTTARKSYAFVSNLEAPKD